MSFGGNGSTTRQHTSSACERLIIKLVRYESAFLLTRDSIHYSGELNLTWSPGNRPQSDYSPCLDTVKYRQVQEKVLPKLCGECECKDRVLGYKLHERIGL